MRAQCLPVLVFLCTNISAQNLIPNPSFEEYTECPDSGYITYATHWTNPCSPLISYPEYYNECSSNVYYTIPERPNHDFQVTHSGEAYAGINPYNGPGINNREYIRTQLISPLSVGRTYYVEFFVNQSNYFDYAINNLSLSFTQNPNNSVSIGNVLDQPVHIYAFGNPILNDTLNWYKIHGIYKALGGEQYVTIGNFSDDENTKVQPTGNSNYPGAYYFLDDFNVELLNSPFWQYHDTTIYYGDSVLIGPALTGLDIDWYTDNLDFISNAPGIYVTPPTSRNYIAKETFNGVETDHVVHVTVIGGAGLEENELQNVRVFPNPSKGSFSISGIASDKPLQLEVRDVHGKLVFEENEVSKDLNSFELDVDQGIYFVYIYGNQLDESYVEKIVVQK
jgi:hypothetical protein